MSFEEILNEGLEYHSFRQWIGDLGGEHFDEYLKKLEDFFYNTLLKQEAENILVMTHAGVIKTLISFHEALSLEEAFALPLSYSEYVCYDGDQERFLYDPVNG